MLGLGSSIVLGGPPQGFPVDAFVMKVTTNISGDNSTGGTWDYNNGSPSGVTNDDQMKLPFNPASGTNHHYVNIDWGDGNTTEDSTTTPTHTYTTAGTYIITITPGSGYSSWSQYGKHLPMNRWFFNNGGDCLKVVDIMNWGCFATNTTSAFNGCKNMVITATDGPGAGVPDYASKTQKWNTALHMFRQCHKIDPDMTNWDTQYVTTFYRCFYNCISVTGKGVENFNLSGLNSTNDLRDTFRINWSDPPGQFNGNISGWDTSTAQSVRRMLGEQDNFDQNLASWDISNITNMTNFMINASGLSTANYDATLIGWEDGTVQDNISVDFGDSKYTGGGAAAAARQALIDDHNWTITDGGTA